MVIKFGNYDFPEKFIKYGSLDMSPSQRQDLDSYTDGYGVTQRTALAHTKTQIQFTTIPMSAVNMDSIMEGITANYSNYNERDAQCTYYNTEKRSACQAHMYLDPSLKFNVSQFDANGNPKKYGEMQWTFIEY